MVYEEKAAPENTEAEHQKMKEESEEQDYSEQARIRREKLASLQKEGNDPFNRTTFDQTHHSAEIKERFEALEGTDVSIAGRLMSFRSMGKASFADVQDRDGRIQSYISVTDIGAEAYAEVKTYDIGDFVGIKGKVFKTRRGEISVHAASITLLAKGLEPLPEKHHGLQDTEMRYRRRYLDLVMNRRSFETFRKRAEIISTIRSFLDAKGFIEVETPVLSAIASGAAARPFVTQSNALNLRLHLRIATELYLKRCIVGGMERVYELGKDFRNEGVDTRHNPEFTMLELYQAYTDYHGMMELCETLAAETARAVCGSTKVAYQGTELEFAAPWRRITMPDAITEYGGPDFSRIRSDEDARKTAQDYHLVDTLKKNLPDCSRGDIMNAAFEKFAEEKLIQPAFVIDYPTDISPLTKQKPGNPDMTERFEAFVYGRELANAYSELNDPIVQLNRFRRQARERELGDDEAYRLDEDFISSLEIGMPPTGGMGIGIDRLVMFLTDSASIRDVILFPVLKPMHD
ncbi:MAG: lysine--tRNA ligase [Treponema sp.]|jgi:lysyl-tRNA synthetase class 2|nr:lysine--tRNA ligase [Treponema sp.]